MIDITKATTDEFLNDEDICRINNFQFNIGSGKSIVIQRDVLDWGVAIDLSSQIPVAETSSFRMGVSDLEELLERCEVERKDAKAQLDAAIVRYERSCGHSWGFDNTEESIPLYGRLNSISRRIRDLHNALDNGGELKSTYHKSGEFVSSPYPTIRLFRNECGWHPVYIITYLHEAFHAYYYLMSGGATSVREIEESIVEASVLSFLKQFGDIYLLSAAYGNISRKQTSGKLACYGFGAYLYSSCKDFGKWMDAYCGRKPSTKPGEKMVDDYCSILYPLYPSDSSAEKKAMDELQAILFPAGKTVGHSPSGPTGLSCTSRGSGSKVTGCPAVPSVSHPCA